MTTVLASTDAVPELVDVLDRRRAQGLDTYDEWWEGVYRIVTGPTPEHGRIGLVVAAPVNVGLDKDGRARSGHRGVPRVDRAGRPLRSSGPPSSWSRLAPPPGHPGTRTGARRFCPATSGPARSSSSTPRWGAKEYLEVDSRTRTVRLLRHDVEQDKWEMATKSAVLPFRLNDDELIADDGGQYRIDWPRDPA